MCIYILSYKFSIVYLSQDIKIIHYMRYMYIIFIEGFLVVSLYICYQVYNTTRNIPIVDIFFFVIVIINFQSN